MGRVQSVNLSYVEFANKTANIKCKLDGQGRARREAARRRNSECKIVEIPLAAMAVGVGLQRSGD